MAFINDIKDGKTFISSLIFKSTIMSQKYYSRKKLDLYIRPDLSTQLGFSMRVLMESGMTTQMVPKFL